MSIRRALLGMTLGLTILSAGSVGVLGVFSIRKNMVREVQSRVNRSLNTFSVYYDGRLKRLAERVESQAGNLSLADSELPTRLERIRRDLSLTVLNICEVDGRPVAGQYPDGDGLRVSVSSDPVLRKALDGKLSQGTVLLDGRRLRLEGGKELADSLSVAFVPGGAALFWWVASPLRDAGGRTVALLYGGQSLNHNNQLVDELRDMLFGSEKYESKPRGTATIFLEGVRVATNVLTPEGVRATGTTVSSEVRERVLEKGEAWFDRAWVVDSWYLSGYEPLRDPSGRIVGMLYVGLLEAPYRALRRILTFRFLGSALLICFPAALIALLVGKRITEPINRLNRSAVKLARGDGEEELTTGRTYQEIENFSRTFREMREAIAERDRKLRERNAELSEANQRLELTNRNYMETLGFVSHELTSPLAALSAINSNLLDGYSGAISEKARHLLGRTKWICEDLQEMVKNYLDLSRLERGELTARKAIIDFLREVVEPVAARMEVWLDSRRIGLRVTCPRGVKVEADSDLMRIVLFNYLSNAVKYGRGREIRLEVGEEGGWVKVSVWNEGKAFLPTEREFLFRKFSRLRSETTRNIRGSGLGLFLCEHIIRLHSGRVWAESEPGRWAAFHFSIPGVSGGTNAEGG